MLKMVSSSVLYLFLVSAAFFPQAEQVSRIITDDPVPHSMVWRSEVRAARQAVANQLQNNLILTLNGLANSALAHTANGTKALATLTTAVTRNTFDLVGVVGYMPKLLGQDLPTQFVEVLKQIRRNEVKVPNDVNSSIDTVLALVRQAEESGITDRVFGPITKFVPNLLTGGNDFLVTIFSSLFSLLGAGANNNN